MKRILLFTLVLIVPFIVLLNISASTIQNSYLVVTVDDVTGRIFLSTLQGRPDVKGDEKKNLLFYDSPPSSYTLIYIDDDILIFGDEPGSLERPVSYGRSIRTQWSYRSIRVVQEVSFVKREKTGVEDGVLVKYTIENNDSIGHKIGCRMLFDTWLGEMGKYHFEISGGRKLSRETIFSGDKVPDFWISTDRKGITCLRGVLKDGFAVKPSRVAFANYRFLFDNLKRIIRLRHTRGFDYLPYSKGDSAVAIYFDERSVDPGKDIKFMTILGLCGEGKYKISENIVKEIKPEVKKEVKEKEKKEEKVYYVENYSEFQKLLNETKTIKKDLQSIDSRIEELNKELEKRDRGEKVDQERILKLKEELGIE